MQVSHVSIKFQTLSNTVHPPQALKDNKHNSNYNRVTIGTAGGAGPPKPSAQQSFPPVALMASPGHVIHSYTHTLCHTAGELLPLPLPPNGHDDHTAMTKIRQWAKISGGKGTGMPWLQFSPSGQQNAGMEEAITFVWEQTASI